LKLFEDLIKYVVNFDVAKEINTKKPRVACYEAERNNKPKVACYGLRGSYTEMATKHYFKSNCEIVYMTTFGEIKNALTSGAVEMAVIPIENSTVGAVAGADEIAKDTQFTQIADFWLPIIHALMAKHGVKLNGIREILSHPQALSQCSKTIESMAQLGLFQVQNPQITPFRDTAGSAEFISTAVRHDIASIAPAPCAQLYGLDILRTALNDNPHNKTHFVVMKKSEC